MKRLALVLLLFVTTVPSIHAAASPVGARTPQADLESLFYAIEMGKTQEALDMLQPGRVSINASNRYGTTVLMWAIIYDQKAVIIELLQRGANIHARNNIGNTALILAAEHGAVEIVEAILTHQSCVMRTVTAQNDDGRTALKIAKRRGYDAIAAKIAAYINVQTQPTQKALIQPSAQTCVIS